MIREVLEKISNEFPSANQNLFEKNPTADFLRREAPEIIKQQLGSASVRLRVDGSAGSGNWAEVPWIAFLDPVVTETATQGYYVVYLFRTDCKRVYLSLNQGATAVEREFKYRTREVLKDRAKIIRTKLSDFSSALSVTVIDLKATTKLAKSYEIGHAMGIEYNLEDLPSEEVLNKDLAIILKAYRALIYRGGLDLDPETTDEQDGKDLSVEQKRQMKMHKAIERPPGVSRKVKKIHGTICQACNLDMSKRYGEIGAGYIEAHHLDPLYTLEEGEVREYNFEKDFAVLCPNCHRMIHKYPDPKSPKPGDLEGFRKIIIKCD